ncbi:MAG TPA: hypothetical protein VF456_09295, partial [Vicinamibacterales bacterium]
MRTVLVLLGLGFAAPLMRDGLKAVPYNPVGDGFQAFAATQSATSAHTMPMVPSELLVRPIDVRANIGHAHDAI